MSSFRSTGVLAAVIALVVGLTVYDYKSQEKKSAEKAEAERVVSLAPADVARLKVTLASGVMVLKQEKGAWRLTEPLQDEVEEEAAIAYVNSFAAEKASPVTVDGRVTDWSKYHLAPAGAALEISRTDGSTASFSVSSRAAFDGSYFIRRGEELLLGTNAWAKVLEKGPNQLRSKKLLRQSGKVTRMRLEFHHAELKDKFTLVRRGDNDWAIAESGALSVAAPKVQEYIDQLIGLRALDFESEKPSADARKSRGVNNTMAKVVLEFEKQEPAIPAWTMEVGAEKDGAHFGVASSVDAIFKLSAYDGEQLRRGRNAFRDGKVPFRLAVEDVRAIRVKAEPQTWKFQKDGSEWKLEGGGEAKANAANLQKLVEKIATLEARDFLSAAQAPKPGFKREAVFEDKEGRPILKVTFGDEFTPATGPHQNTKLVYAKSSRAGEILAVPAADVGEIPFDQLTAAEGGGEKDSQQSEKR